MAKLPPLQDDAPQAAKVWAMTVCTEIQDKCICGRPLDHEPPHRCADEGCRAAWEHTEDGMKVWRYPQVAPERDPLLFLRDIFGDPEVDDVVMPWDEDVIPPPPDEDAAANRVLDAVLPLLEAEWEQVGGRVEK